MKLRLASIVAAAAIIAGAYPFVQLHLAAQGKGASQAEPDSDLDGTVEVVYEDGYTGPRLKHFVRVGTDRVELDFGGSGPRHLRTGSRIRARGKLRNGKLAVNPLDVAALGGDVAALGGGGGEGSTQALVSPYTFGVQPTLVILFNFSDLTQTPYTTGSANTVTFTQVNNFDLENSFSQTSLSGQVVGWYTIASSATAQGCNYNAWATQAEAAATAAGVNLSLYPRRVFGFPQTSACNWWGLGTIGGGGTAATPSRAWINGTYSLRVVAHEMGHNFGLYHSQSRTCDSTNGCFLDEYGDDHDVMGGGPNSVIGHFNAYQKERLGWLNYGSSPTITNVNGSGQYALEPYAKPWTGGSKALKIVRSTGASNTYLYAEARTSFGMDTGLPAGIVIHTGNDFDGSQIFEEDVQPTTLPADFILDPGQSVTFSDAVPPVTIQTLTATATGATLQITQACMNSLGSSGQSFGDTGGPGTVALTTGTNCAWTATSDSAWLTVNAGSASGTGSATINFTVAANPGAGRTGTLTIAGQTFTVTQAANACLFTVTPLNPSVNHTAASYSVNVTATPTSCSWTATSNTPAWITVTAGASGTGNGTVTYSVTANASHTGHTGTLSVAGQTVTVFQEGLAGQLISPANGATNVKTTNVMMLWTGQTGVQSYRLTIGTTVGAADVYDSGEVTGTNKTVPSMPASRLLYARLRTTWPDAATPKQDISFTTVDRISGLQVLGSQSSNPVVAGGSTQYGASAANSVKVSFTGSTGGCTATFGATGLPTGATATFTPTSAASSAADQFTLLSVATTTATPPGSYTFNVTAQESAVCNSPAATVTVTGVPLVVFGSTSLSTATATGTYGGSAAVSATLTAGGTPVSGKSVSFTLNGNAVGSGTTDASGVASLGSASLTGVNAGSFPSGVVASFAGDANYGASSANNSLTVSQKSITPSVTAGNKAYDGTTSATLTGCTLSGVVGADVVTCSGSGTASFASAAIGTAKTVTVSGLALSGAAAGNYTLSTTTATTTANITVVSLTPTVTASSRTYDATTNATLTGCTLSGVIGLDVVTCSASSAAFATAAVGTGKTVTASGITLGGLLAGNYTLSTTTATATANITAASVTPSVTAANKSYSGTASATITACTLSGVIGADVVTCSGTATFGSAGVGTGKTVTASGIALAGAQATNYVLSTTTATTTANITSASVTPSVTAANKSYDATASATITACTLSGVIGADVVTCSGTATFGTTAVGTGKTVTATGISLAGAQAANYALSTTTATTTANITGATLSPSVTAANKSYNGNTSATLTGCTLSGVIGGDVVACTGGTATFATAAAGTARTVTANGLTLSGAQAGNYSLSSTTATTTANITAASVTPSVTAANKPYNGNATATITTCTPSGVVGGDVVTCSGTASFASAVVGTSKTVNATGITLAGAAAANYTLSATTATTTADITAATLTPAITATNKTYDGAASAAISCTLTGVVGGDVVACIGTGSFDSIAVGTGKTVTSSNLALSGAAASNYALSATGATTTANITAKTLTPAITATNRTYDGTSSAAINCTLTGVIGGDVVACSGTGSFGSAAVGAGKTVTSSNLALNGAAGTNYALSTTSATTTANITAATVTPAITATSKAYDGTSSAAISCILTGVVGGDVVSCSGAGSFASPAVGTGRTVTGNGLTLSGAAASNYALSATGATTTANITPKTLTPAITATNKTYDGIPSAAISCTLTGVMGGDVVTCSGTGSFGSAAVGTGKTVTSSNLALNGAAASNYALSTTSATTTANITAATVTPAITATSKAYDGAASAAISCTLTGVVGSDVVSCSGTGSFDSSAVGTGKTVTSSNLALSGAAASNYALSATGATTTANITAKTLTPAITATNRTYDGTSSAAINCTLTGVIGGDVVACSGTGSFGSAAVGAGKTVTSSNLALNGAAGTNYALSTTSATTTANITAATVTPAITATSKAYDGTSSAAISCILTGVVGGDVVSCSGTGSFASPAVGTGRTVTGNGLTLSGAAASNYALSATSATTTANITAATLTPAISATSKTYDGTASVAISCTLTGVVGGDVVTCGGTGSFASPAVGTSKTVTANGLTLSGAAAGNYALSATSATTTANITAATLTPAISATGKTYDGTASAAIGCTLTGVVGGDVVTCGGTGSFASPAVGISKTVTANGLTLSGAAAGNYSLSTTSATTTANITAAAVTPAITATSKAYDGTASVAISCTLTGVVGGDVVSCSGTGSFASPAVGTGRTVTGNGLTLSGAAASNYALSATSATTTANITAATLTPAISATSKTYDGTASVAISCTLTGVVGGDVVTCGGTGSFASPAVGTSKTVTANGLTLSGAAAGNYSLSTTSATTTANITAATVTPAITATSKAYDGTASVAISCTLTGVVGGDVVTCGGTGSFASPAVGTSKTVTANGLTLSGAAASNYSLSTASATTTADITPRNVTPSVTAASKSYDGTTTAALTSCTVSGVVAGDAVACSGAAIFNSAEAGTGKTVTANGLVLSGPAAGNYALATTTATTVASITAIDVTPSITVASKIYDGTIAADMTACTVTGVIAGDVVTCDGVALFDSAIVGAGKPVMAIDLSLEGPQAGNYDLSTTTATATADITSVALTAAATVAGRLYNGTTIATLTSCTLTGVVSDDIVTCSGTATFNTASIGTGKPVTIANVTLGGPSAQNYYLTSTTTAATASILALSVTPTITVASKTYDKTEAATLTSCTLSAQSGVADAIALVWDSNPVGDAIVGYWVLVGTAPGDYQQIFDAGPHPYFFYPNPVPGQQYFFAVSAYNDTGISPIAEITGSSPQATIPSGDAVGCAGTPEFDTEDIGPSKTVTVSGLTLTGAASTNYTLSTTTATATATINGIALTPTIAAASKTYDGTSTAAISCTLAGVVSGDDVTCSGTGTFDTASAGIGKTVTSSNLVLSGPAAGNYTLSTTSASTTAAIGAATLTPAITAASRTYDGTSTAAISCTLSGVIGGDAVTCDGSGSFASAAVGNGKSVTVSNLTLGGAQAGNYILFTPSATTTAAITTATLTPAITAVSKTYDGSSTIAVSCTLTGVVGSDVVTCAGTGTFDSSAVGAAKTVTSSNLVLGGPQAGNYSLSTTTATTTASVSGAVLTPAISAASKTYDGTSTAAIACTLTGVVSGDVVSCSGTGSFDTPSAGIDKTVTSSNMVLGGAQAANYTLTSTTATTTGAISRANATPVVTVASKVYDGTTSAMIVSCTVTGIIGADQVACTGTAAFQDRTAGSGKTVVVTNLSLVGPAAANYQLIDVSLEVQPLLSVFTAADITPASVIATVTAGDKVYDGAVAATLTSCTLSDVSAGDDVRCVGSPTFTTSNAGVGKTVTVSGLTLTGADAGNYVLTSTTASTTASITPATLTPAITATSKTYDGSSSAAISCSLTGVVGGDVVSCSGTGSFDSSAVGTAKTVTSSSLALNGAAASNYALSATTATTTANIAAATLTPAITATNKPYDGTSSAAISCTLTGVLGSDVVACAGTGSFDSAAVGNGKTITANGLSLSGAQATNYALSATTATTTANITAATLTPAITATNKTYDGTSAAAVNCTLTGVVGSDVVACGGTGSFDTASVDTGKTVTANGLSVSGAQATNYALAATTATTTANITAATLTPAITATNKTYDGTSPAAVNCTLTGVVGSDVVACGGTGSFDTASVGTGKTVTASNLALSGAAASNYALSATTVRTTASITAATLTPAITATNKIYDGTSSVAVSCTLTGVVGSDVVACVGTGSFDSAGVGTGKTVTASNLAPNGVAASNYELSATTATTTANITAATLTPAITATSKTYDGTSSAAVNCSLTGVVGSDVVACGGTGTFDTAAVGTGKTVTANGLSLSGAAASNYEVSATTATTTANITSATLTPAITATNKTYDSTSSATISCTLTGVVGSDVVACAGTSSFDSAAVGTGKTVTTSGLSLSGAAASNYALAATTATTTANITAATLTPAITATSKTYDGTSSVAVSCTLTGVVGSDVVACVGTGSFDSAPVGTGKTVTANGLTLSGAQATNYALSATSATTTANITAATLTPAITATNKTYDGTSAAAVNCTLTGVVGSDVVACAGTGSFDSSAVGTGKTVTASNLALNGAAASNYELSATTATTTANITAATLTPAITATSKTYDGTSSVAVSCTLTGVVGGDVVSCVGTGSFDSSAVGTGKTVTANGLTLSGVQATNYALAATTATTTANITAATLTPAITVTNKVYDATASAAISCTLTGVVGSDVVACVGTGSFDTASVGTGKTVTASNLALNGAAASNYELAATTATTTANITAATVTPAITATNKTYDGTPSAAVNCSLIGVVGSDVVACGGTGTFDTAAVGTGKTVTANGLTLSGAAASNYALAATTAMATANITAATLTPAITATNKTYDSTSSAAVNCTLIGVVGGDVVACVGTGSFDTPAVGTSKTVTANGLTLSGAAASNYALSATTATTTASITAATLTPAITATNKIYDGTSSVAVSCTLTGVVGSDVVACVGTGSFDSSAVGTGKTVTANGLSLSGTAAGNYALLTTTATTTANVTAATLTPAITAPNKTYDGTSTAAISCTLTGVVGSDVVACAGTGSFDSSSIGTSKSVTATSLALSGAAASNYALSATSATTTANITPATLTPAVTASSKPYDGTTAATLAGCTVSGVIGSDVVGCAWTAAAFDSAAAGTGKTVTATGLTLTGATGNYTLATTTATTTAAISALNVTPTVTVSNKTYDGTMTAAVSSCAVGGLIGSDSVSCSGTALFESASAGVGKTVQISSLALTGPAASNYTLISTSATSTATITPLSVTAAPVVASRVYDGTIAATLSNCAAQGAVEGDAVTCAGTATFDTAAAGASKTVTITSLALNGAAASNYALSTTTVVTTGAIAQRTVTPAVTIANKRFDGTTGATITACTLSGLIAGDAVICTGNAAFASAAVGSNKQVTVSQLSLTGTAAANYALSTTTATATASVTANTAPLITNPGAQAGYQSTPVALALNAIDADSDPLTWSAQALPPGIALNSTTGAFSGAPTTPGAFMTTVSATDGFDTTQISFMWNVASAIPVAASPLAPSGSIATTTPTISWSAVPLVEYYLLWIADSGADSPLQIWYTPAQAGCATGGTCAVSLPRALKAGLVTWKVLTWNHFGYGPWSTTVSAVVDLADALVPTPATSAPSGPIATRIPTYSWSAVSNATWYQLSVTDALNVVREFWYTPAEACTVTSCAVTPNTAVATGLGKWRVRAWRASGVGAWSAFVNFDAADALPGKVTLVSPSGSVTTSTPSFTWLAMPTTSYYLLNVTDRDNVTYERWYRPADAGCALGTGTCTVAPGILLKAGTASWKVLTWNGKGYGPWSDTRDILIEIADASAPVPLTVSPTGTINSTTVPYRWTSVTGALNYRFSIRNNGGAPTYLWFTPAAAGCSADGDCVVTPQITLTNGTAEWQVQAWTNNGYGAWSSLVALTVNVAAPSTPVLVSPNGTLATAAPQLRWNASDNAVLYYARLFDSTGQRIDKWLSPAQVGCATGGVCTLNAGVTLAAGGGSWQVIAWNPAGYSAWSATMAFTVP